MAIQKARSFDRLKLDKDIDEEDYEDAIAYYKLDSES